MDKKTFRKIYRKKREMLPKETIERQSKYISEIVLASEEYKLAEKLFSYVNFANEISTTSIIKKAFSDGKKVAVPFADESNSTLYFIEIHGYDELSLNRFGILQPEYNEDKCLKCDEKTLVTVPLLAYNSQKIRMGYGGGYYDRFIASNKALSFMGLGFDWQLDEDIPYDDFDKQLDIIVTNRGVIK